MRSAAPIQASDLPDAWRAFQIWSIRSTCELKTTAFQQLYRRIDLAVIWIVGSGALFVMAGALRKRLSILGTSGEKECDAHGTDLVTLAITATVCLPVVFALAIPGGDCAKSIGSVGYVHAVDMVCWRALVLTAVEFFRQMARPQRKSCVALQLAQ